MQVRQKNKQEIMKSIIITIIGALLLSTDLLYAQNAHFVTSGTIEYEKTVNMFALIKRQIAQYDDTFLQSFFESYKKNNPQFKKLKSTLSFSDDRTMFVPAEPEGSDNFFG